MRRKVSNDCQFLVTAETRRRRQRRRQRRCRRRRQRRRQRPIGVKVTTGC